MQPLETAPAGIRRPIIRRSGGALLALLLACLCVGSSIDAGRADGYPERTIKIIVPFPAGGPTDVAARLVAQSLSPRLGHNVIVETRPARAEGSAPRWSPPRRRTATRCCSAAPM